MQTNLTDCYETRKAIPIRKKSWHITKEWCSQQIIFYATEYVGFSVCSHSQTGATL